MAMTSEDRRALKGTDTIYTLQLAYTIEDAVVASGLARSRLYQLIGANELQARKAGRRTIILGESLRNYLENLPAANIRAPKQTA